MDDEREFCKAGRKKECEDLFFDSKNRKIQTNTKTITIALTMTLSKQRKHRETAI